MRKRKRLDETFPLALTSQERDTLLAGVLLPPGAEDTLRLGEAEHGWLTFRFTPADLDDLQGYVAAMANHAKSRKVEKILDGVFEKIEDLLNRCTDKNG